MWHRCDGVGKHLKKKNTINSGGYQKLQKEIGFLGDDIGFLGQFFIEYHKTEAKKKVKRNFTTTE